MAHALTAARLLLAVPFTVLMLRGDLVSALLAALVLAAAITSDVLDGIVARRHGTASTAGRLFDHAVDCIFVTAGLAAGAARGVFPWLLPALVAGAFGQYVLDSYGWHREGSLRPSRLGRLNGILYFAPLAGDLLVRGGLAPIRPLVTGLAWILVATTVVSMAGRAWAVKHGSDAALGSRAGGTGVRPRR